jgi:hypothetical protein
VKILTVIFSSIAAILFFAAMLFLGAYVGSYVPNKWRDAVVVEVCGGYPVVRRKDGEVWLLRRGGDYRVENLGELRC